MLSSNCSALFLNFWPPKYNKTLLSKLPDSNALRWTCGTSLLRTEKSCSQETSTYLLSIYYVSDSGVTKSQKVVTTLQWQQTMSYQNAIVFWSS